MPTRPARNHVYPSFANARIAQSRSSDLSHVWRGILQRGLENPEENEHAALVQRAPVEARDGLSIEAIQEEARQPGQDGGVAQAPSSASDSVPDDSVRAIGARFGAETESVARGLITQGVPASEIFGFLQLSMPPRSAENPATPLQRAEQESEPDSSAHAIQRQPDHEGTEPDTQGKGDPFGITLPGITRLEGWKSKLLLNAVGFINPALAPILTGAIVATNAYDMTIGIGPNVSGGAGGGYTFGAGLVFAPGAVVGVYGTANVNIGFLASISATASVTVIDGGIESFAGQAVGVTLALSLFKLIGGSGTLIFRSMAELRKGNVKPFGFTAEVGIGAGLSPVEVFVSLQNTGVMHMEEIQRLQRKRD